MQPGDRCIYIPPPGDPRPQRWATVYAISGQSAFVVFDHLGWLSAAPIERLHLAEPGAAGFSQLLLFSAREKPMNNKELLKELREMRMLLDALHSDARGNGHGPCTCKPTGPVCPLHAQVRQHLITATNSLRDAVIVINESMTRST